MNHRECEGCKGGCRTSFVFLSSTGEPIQCPCSYCLIKVMCINECDSFSLFIERQEEELLNG